MLKSKNIDNGSRGWDIWALARYSQLLCLLAVLVVSCQPKQVQTEPWKSSAEPLVWPEPPAKARIAYVGSISSKEDLGAGTGFGGWLKGIFVGRESSRLVTPMAVGSNGASQLVIADPDLNTVHFLDLKKKKYSRLTSKFETLLASPVGIAVDQQGRTYVADSERARIFVFQGSDKLIAEWGEGTLVRPSGIALNPQGTRVYVVDTSACRVVVFDQLGNQVQSFGHRGGNPGEFNYPTYIAVGPEGEICVSDSLNFRVQVFNPDGSYKLSFGKAGDGSGTFTRPKGIGVDRLGQIYVADSAFENVQIFDSSGQLLTTFGSPGEGPGEFTLPTGVYVDSESRIWVADSQNGRVQIFRLLEGEEEAA